MDHAQADLDLLLPGCLLIIAVCLFPGVPFYS